MDRDRAPERRAAAVRDHGRVGAGDAQTESLLVKVRAEGFRETHSDPEALEIGKSHQTADPALALPSDERQNGAKGDGRFVPHRDEALRAAVQARAQIVMTRKHGPDRGTGTENFESDLGSPKTPPCDFSDGQVEDPVRLQPLRHVVVARDGDESGRDRPGADPFGKRGGRHFRDGPIDHARKFVERDDPVFPVRKPGERKGAGKVAAEFLAVAQHRVRLHPPRRGTETDGGQKLRDFPGSQVLTVSIMRKYTPSI